MQNLEDAAPEWLIGWCHHSFNSGSATELLTQIAAPETSRCMLQNFHETFPDIMRALPNLRLIEQYDPSDLTEKSQPYAYVADTVQEIKLGVDIDDIRGQGVPSEQWSAILSLRDKLAEGQKVGWFAVVCGDEERLVSPPSTPKQAPSSLHQSNGSIGSRKFSLRPSTASASTRDTSSSSHNIYTDTSPMGNGFPEKRVGARLGMAAL